MHDIKTKEFTVLTPFVVKEVDVLDKTGDSVIKISGYCNWAGKDEYGATYTDLAGDVVVPHGVDLSIWKDNPQILWQHDRDETAGKGLLIERRDDGLYIEAEIHKEALGPKEFYRVKAGLVSMFSIGFRTLDCEYREVDGKDVFFITKSLLLEVSVVSIPCNSKSSFSVVKSLASGDFTSDMSKRLTATENTTEIEKEEVIPMKVKLADGQEIELVELIKNTIKEALDARDAAAAEAAATAAAAAAESEKEAAATAAAVLAAAEVEKEAAATAAATAATEAASEALKSIRAELGELKALLAA